MFFVRALWVCILVVQSVSAAAITLPDPHDTAYQSMEKGLSFLLASVHQKVGNSESEKRARVAAIQNSARSLIHSFFHPLFLDQTPTMQSHRAFVREMWERLRLEFEENPELFDASVVPLILAAIEDELQASRALHLKDRSMWGRSFKYSVLQTATMEILFRRGVAYKKRIKELFAKKPEAQPAVAIEDRAPRSYNLKSLCARALKAIWPKSVYFVGRHLAAGAVYSIPNYFWEFRPIFWGFNNYEPWDFSTDLMENEVKPYLRNKLK